MTFPLTFKSPASVYALRSPGGFLRACCFGICVCASLLFGVSSPVLLAQNPRSERADHGHSVRHVDKYQGDATGMAASDGPLPEAAREGDVFDPAQTEAGQTSKPSRDVRHQNTSRKAASSQTAHPVGIPLTFQLPEATLAPLTPSERQLLEAVLQATQRELFLWESYPIELPPSVVERTGKVSEIAALYRTPGDDELDQVARGADGELLALNQTQLEQIRLEAAFTVPSQHFEGQSHVWKVAPLLQKGRQNTRMSLEEDNASAVRYLVMDLPEHLLGEDRLSVRQGLGNIVIGVREVLGLAIGLVEEVPSFDQAEVEARLADARARFLFDTLAPAVRRRGQETRPALVGDGAERVGVNGDGAAMRPFTSEELLALRRHDQVLMAQARAVVDRIWARVQTAHQAGLPRLEADLEASPGLKELEGTALIQALADGTAQALHARFLEALRHDATLEGLSPGLGRMLADHAQALRIVTSIELDEAERLARVREEARAHLKERYPVRSRIGPWLERWLSRALEDDRNQVRWRVHERIRDELDAAKLPAQAKIVAASLAFHRTMEPAVRAALEAARRPAATFEWSRRIWQPRNWVVTKVSDPNTGETRFQYQTQHTRVVTTAMRGWRWYNAALRTGVWLNNSLFQLVPTALWNGRLGLHALFGLRPFYARMTIDPIAGALVPDPYSITPTMASRVGDLWKDVRRSRDEFEAQPDVGFIGKRFTRWFHRGWNYGVRGGGGTVLLVLGQPILTLANVGVSGMLAASAVAWVPAASAAKMVVNATLWDFEDPDTEHSRPILPLLAQVGGRIVVEGGAQTIAGASLGLIMDPARFLLRGTAGNLRALTRTTYDWLIFGVVIRPLGRVPARDGFLARHVAGPGLASHYYVQLKPELALLAIQSQLEREELRYYRDRAAREIGMPRAKAEEFLTHVFGPVLAGAAWGSALKAPLERAENAQLGALHQAVRAREVLLSKASHPASPWEVRQSQADLVETLRVGSGLVQQFCTERLLPSMGPQQRADFWRRRKLRPEDWVGLTQELLSRSFSPAILQPLEETDQTFRLVVAHPALRDQLKGLERGAASVEYSKVSIMARVAGRERPAPAVPVIDSRAIFRRPTGLAGELNMVTGWLSPAELEALSAPLP